MESENNNSNIKWGEMKEEETIHPYNALKYINLIVNNYVLFKRNQDLFKDKFYSCENCFSVYPISDDNTCYCNKK